MDSGHIPKLVMPEREGRNTMMKKLRSFELDTLVKAVVAGGIIILVALALILSAFHRPELLPLVVPSLVSLLAWVFWHYFARKG
jgi:hypothetical protein